MFGPETPEATKTADPAAMAVTAPRVTGLRREVLIAGTACADFPRQAISGVGMVAGGWMDEWISE
jgi:hypothetical protein